MTVDSPSTDSSRVAAIVRATVARPWTALMLCLIVTAGAGWWGSEIHIAGDMEALFPEDTPTIARAKKARELVGSHSELIVLIGSEDRELNRRVGRDIAARLAERTDEVARVDFERDTALFETNALLYLPLEELRELDEQVAEVIREAVRKDMALDDFDDEETPEKDAKRLPTEDELKAQYGANDLQRYFESPDGQVIAVKAYPHFKPQDVSKTTAFVQEVDAMLATVTAEHDVETVIVGDYTGISKSVNAITDALARSSAAALLLIMIVLAVYFRRLQAIVLVLLPLLAGIAWTVCYARLFIGQLNLISAFIFAILIGLGIDFAVHAVSRVDESAREGRTRREALIHALPRLGRAMGVAATTTIATFLSLTIFDFRGFSQFGWIAAAGVALSLSAVYLLLPPLSLVLRRRSEGAPAPAPNTPAAASGGRTLAWVTVGTALIAAGVAATALPDLHFDGDMRKMRIASPPETNALRRKYFMEAERRLPSPALIITDDQAETERVYRHLVERSKHERRLKSVVSLFTFIPDGQEEKLAVIAEMKRRIDNKYGLLEGKDKADADRLRAYLSPKAFGVDDLPEWVRESFTDTTGAVGRYVLLYASGVKSLAREVLEIQAAIGQVEIDGKTYHSTAAWMFTGDAYMTVRREGPLAVGLAALVVFFLLLADVRRLGAAVLAFLPLLVGFVLFLGVMAWAQISLNLFNIVVLPVIFGIGVDTAIHLTHRLREGSSVREMLRTTGAAAAVSAVTTAIGFGSLLTVASEGLQSIGWVAVIGIGCTTLTTTALIAAFATLQRPESVNSTQADA